MAHCKHWHNGICKDCKKNCPIKAKLTRKAAKAQCKKRAKFDTDMEFAVAPPSLVEALAHGERVAHLAAQILAGLSPDYGIAAPWDTVLHTAARLHDVGWVYGQKEHHKISARMIRAGSVEEVEKSLRPLAALVARYHRQTVPSRKQRRFAELSSLDRRGVRRMAALLRLADALDYSHAGLVQNVEVQVQKDAVLLVLDCAHQCPAEVERLAAKKQLFKKVFKKDVLCQCKTQECPTPEQTDSPVTGQVNSPMAKQTDSPLPKQTDSPTQEQASSPTAKQATPLDLHAQSPAAVKAKPKAGLKKPKAAPAAPPAPPMHKEQAAPKTTKKTKPKTAPETMAAMPTAAATEK